MATVRRSSCPPEGPAGETRYQTFSVDMPRPVSPTCRIVSRSCPPTQIILPIPGKIRIYRAPRNNTADMSMRLCSGPRCRDTLGLPITDDDDDDDDDDNNEDAIETRVMSVNTILEHSLARVTVMEYIDERLTRKG